MRVKTRKAVGPDGISGRVLKTCANQLAPVFTTIFNLSIESVVRACFQVSSIFPLPMTASPTCLNDYRPVAAVRLPANCSWPTHCSSPTGQTDPQTMSPRKDTAPSLMLIVGRMLFIDFSSAFNTIVPARLAGKLIELGLNPPLCA